MTTDREARRNAFLYCKFRDEQFSLYDEFAKRHGLQFKQLLVANVLFYAEDGLAQSEICRRTFMSKQAVNQIVAKFAALGQATVLPDPASKRSKIVRLTPKGRKDFEYVVRHVTCSEDDAMAMLTAEEQETLIRLSRKYTANHANLINRDMEKELP